MNCNQCNIQNDTITATAKSLFCKQNFKGVESFLRKVAFNLGNTPSQTEVKIISCIPIDVSDLQEKIKSLEKQLEEMKCRPTVEKSQQQTNESVVLPTLMDNKFQGSTNSSDMKSRDSHKSYKLSKDPEIKKSLPSERVLPTPECPERHEHSPSKSMRRPINSVAESVPRTNSTRCESTCDSTRKRCENQPAKQSKISFICPTMKAEQSDDVNNLPYKMDSQTCNCCHSYVLHEELSTSQPESSTCQPETTTCQPETTTICQPETTTICQPEPKAKQRHRNIFKNRKLLFKSKKNKTQLVYSAQTTDSPYVRSEVDDEYSDTEDPVSRAYFAEMLEKQYRPRIFFSDSSKLTSPICRDILPTSEECSSIDLDISSCCYEPFKNTDKCSNIQQSYMINEVNTGNAYYDSSLYDLIPVKEQTEVNKATIQNNNQKKTYKNSACLTTAMKNNECQTINSTQVTKTKANNNPKVKTDVIIDEIKNTLQSVLAEVKISTQNKHATGSKTRKDAVVQIGTSENLMEEYSYQNTITYNPFNTNPYLSAIYCHQMEYYHNWPFLYQPQFSPEQFYYMNVQQKPSPPKPTTTIATNTDLETQNRLQTNNGTHNLIIDLYKTVSMSEYNQKFSRDFQKVGSKNLIHKVSNAVQTVSKMFLRKNSGTYENGNATTKIQLNGGDMQSRGGTHTDYSQQRRILAQYARTRAFLNFDMATDGNYPCINNNSTPTKDESSSEDESDTIVIAPVRISYPKKVLAKIKSVFKPKEPSGLGDDDDVDESSNDTDDQTIHSHKISKPLVRRIPPPAINFVYTPRGH